MNTKKNYYDLVVKLLAQRGVKLADIEKLVYFLQKDYTHPLTHEKMMNAICNVLSKREVQNAIMTGIQLDVLAEKKQLQEPLQSIMEKDESLYGVDEILTFSITNLYGSISFTNYGYIDRVKPGILKWLNDRSTGKINVFLDDLVGAVAASAAARLAHDNPALEHKEH